MSARVRASLRKRQLSIGLSSSSGTSSGTTSKMSQSLECCACPRARLEEPNPLRPPPRDDQVEQRSNGISISRSTSATVSSRMCLQMRDVQLRSEVTEERSVSISRMVSAISSTPILALALSRCLPLARASREEDARRALDASDHATMPSSVVMSKPASLPAMKKRRGFERPVFDRGSAECGTPPLAARSRAVSVADDPRAWVNADLTHAR